ncbi:MAG: hypothetical protein ORN51_04710, partial [Akkermansiaceae bacterium]|nr:hypothetical protein [Akkermansiaceae bacterium]
MKPHMKNRAVTVMKANRLSGRAGVLAIGLVFGEDVRVFICSSPLGKIKIAEVVNMTKGLRRKDCPFILTKGLSLYFLAESLPSSLNFLTGSIFSSTCVEN